MTIGIASPISSGCFLESLDDASRIEALGLSTDCAPAVTSLAKEFLNMGQRVVIFTLDPKATCQMVLRGKNLVIYVAPATSPNKFKRALSPFLGRNIRLIKKLFEVNSEKLDVLSVHWTRDYALAARQFLGNIPVFVTVRDIIPYIIKKQKWNIHSYNWAIIYIMNEMVMRNNKYNFIANSEYTAVMVKHYWNRNIPIIPNPILDEYFNLNYTVDKSPQPFVLSTISISAPDDKRKNIHTLLKAFHIVRTKNKNVTLNLIGASFISDNHIIMKWKADGLLDGVKLCGSMKHDDVLKILCETHLMVHPSLEETFGNTLIEAMAVGCPVLGGENSGAVPYVLNHGKAGWLCDVTKEEKLAKAILDIIANPIQAFTKACVAKLYCKERFSSSKVAKQYIQIFNSKIDT